MKRRLGVCRWYTSFVKVSTRLFFFCFDNACLVNWSESARNLYPTSSLHITANKCTCQNGVPTTGEWCVVLSLVMFTQYFTLPKIAVEFSFGMRGL